MRTVIYGAQSIALGAYNSIKINEPDLVIECFLVTTKEDNPTILGGLRVRELQEFVAEIEPNERGSIQVLIATPENVMDTIANALRKVGIVNYRCLDSITWAKMQELAFTKTKCFLPISYYHFGEETAKVNVYKMIHENDKKLTRKYKDARYVTPLQVGAALSKNKIVSIGDNSGENISDKNANYSELTGLYWMWKNQLSMENEKDKVYYGLAHYRRRLELSEDDLKRLVYNDIDVVLPYPMPYEPNIEAHHRRYLLDEEWSAVLQAVEELEPQYAEKFSDVLRQHYFYNYNVIIAKGSIIDAYCSWLFPILFRIEKIIDSQKVREPNRYIGYIGETLETLFFMCNVHQYKIAHAGCRFLT